MQLIKLEVANFRLLHDVALLLEPRITIVVGRNNSGKTSLAEIMKRILDEGTLSFRLEDFSFRAHSKFWEAFTKWKSTGSNDAEVRQIIPSICVKCTFSYDKTETLGTISDFVIDVDEQCTEALVHVAYRLRDGKVGELFSDLPDINEEAKPAFFQTLRDRIPTLFSGEVYAVDPNDPANRRDLELATLKRACAGAFIFAQRGLDDISHKDRVVIGKVLENLFATAKLNSDDKDSFTTAQELELAVKAIQVSIGADFNKKLDALLPALSLFGYPGLSGSQLLTETTLDVSRLLSNNTKVRYSGSNGVHLPESYNGLGARNIILMLLQLREFFKAFLAMETRPAVHLVFVEEPEVHLHPQMQEVFIRKLGDIAEAFSKESDTPWPVQFIVSTHSSHIANEAHFETIRYFLAKTEGSGAPRTIVKDLRKGLANKTEPDRTFLHQYMTLTRCDLFFADKAILIEGTTERLLLPKIIARIDLSQPQGKQLSSQYLSVIEIGGAYAHLFFDLIEFLELRTLVITDIDSVAKEGGKMKACPVSKGEATSNACIKSWFAGLDIQGLLALKDDGKTVGHRRIAFQIAETAGGPCGRSFEDAFMLANESLFPAVGTSPEEKAAYAYSEASGIKKSQFALEHALSASPWNTPRYIRDGLLWLAESDSGSVVGTVAVGA